MAFKPIKFTSSGQAFNSACSCDFKEFYDSIYTEKCREEDMRKPSETFAPSAFRCDRVSFFRLKGVEPDPQVVNPHLSFSAMLGTACHREIQANLKASLKDNWVTLKTFLENHPISWEYEIKDEDEFETRIKIADPPISFAVDGVINFKDHLYLLEIKSSEHQSFEKLTGIKPKHLDQIKVYCTVLNIDECLVLYVDRLYGDTKCFQYSIKKYEKRDIVNRMRAIQDYAKHNIAPEKLPSGSYECTYCKYSIKCKQWG